MEVWRIPMQDIDSLMLERTKDVRGQEMNDYLCRRMVQRTGIYYWLQLDE